MAFPPKPVYPNAIDSDETLYLVHNTSESVTTADNAPWSEEISIVPVAADKDDLWADNGFANIDGELFYYGSVEKDDNGKVYKFKRCARNLGGTDTKFNPAGSEVRGFVVAQHHNQIVAGILNVENFIGENFTEDQATLDWRIRNLQAVPVVFDDFGCPDIDFTFNVLSTDPSTGTTARYFIQISGSFTSYRLDFGDGSFTTTSTQGTHQYASGATIDPVITVSNEKCTLVQTPVERNTITEPSPQDALTDFEIKIPTIPDIPEFVFPSIVQPDLKYNIPPIVFPCLDIGPIGPINIPSVITVDPPINIPSYISITPISFPSQIVVVGGFDLPSTISITPISLPSIISITPISLPSIISIVAEDIPETIYVVAPSFPPIYVNVPAFPPVYIYAPSFPPIYIQAPAFPPVYIQAPSFPPVYIQAPSFPPIYVQAPSFPPITVTVDAPSFPPITVTVDAPSFPPITVNVETPSFPPIYVSVPSFPPVFIQVPSAFPDINVIVPSAFPDINVLVPSFPPITVEVPSAWPDISVIVPDAWPDISVIVPSAFPDITVSVIVPSAWPDISVIVPSAWPDISVIVPSAFPDISVISPESFPDISVISPESFPDISVISPSSFPDINVIVPSAWPGISVIVPDEWPGISVISPDGWPDISVISPDGWPDISVIVPESFPDVSLIVPSTFPDVYLVVPSVLPSITVDWGTCPTCMVSIVCPTGGGGLRAQRLDDEFQDGFDNALTMDLNNIGIPSQIELIVPKIPDIRVIHDIPVMIDVRVPEIKDIEITMKKGLLPSEIHIINDTIMPSVITLVDTLPNTIAIDASNMPLSIPLVFDKSDLPIFKLDVTDLPTEIKVVGIPSTIELVGNIPSTIQLLMPDKPEIEMVYRGAPIDVKIHLDTSKLTGEEQNLNCVAIVPCNPNK